jgi:hypothetical protein
VANVVTFRKESKAAEGNMALVGLISRAIVESNCFHGRTFASQPSAVVDTEVRGRMSNRASIEGSTPHGQRSDIKRGVMEHNLEKVFEKYPFSKQRNMCRFQGLPKFTDFCD